MSNDLVYPLITALVSLLFSGFFSGMEIAFVSSNKVRVEIDVKKSGLINRIIDMFYAHKDTLISTLLVGNNIANVVYGMAIAQLCLPMLKAAFGQNEAVLLLAQTLISTVIVLFAGEFLPKTMFRINPNRSLRACSPLMLMIYTLLWPVSKFTSLLSAALMRLVGIKADTGSMGLISVDELDAYLQENIDKREDENKDVEQEVKIFENALDFSDTHLRDCMVPRNEIVGVDIADTSREELSRLFTRSGLSKIVVYHDDVDNVLGFIQVSEMFVPEVNWKDRIKPVLFAPETMLAKKMMQNLLKEKKSMAIVVDEFGGTAGMVTLEDLVEEIFGEIEDEHDRPRLVSRKIDDNTYEFSGRMEIEDINDNYHLNIPESEDYQTIAGFLLNRLEEIPNEGDTADIDGMRLTVLKKTSARIELVRLTMLDGKKRE
ncbi:MAG: hemolysin family protein [Bacteroidales bacterium]|nr:hemolysin family protein [Bacteroidales bacterium]MDY3912751.1 hemolysin family protein [Sodaliphilus sp.]